MGSKHRSAQHHQRDQQRIAQVAARMMQESGSRDIRHARLKAARQLGLDDPSALPDEAQITQALDQQLRLFAPASRTDALHEKRLAAVQAMTFLDVFSPRLVGPVLNGTADAASPVQLHLHSDTAESVQQLLDDQRIPATLGSIRLRLKRGNTSVIPCWRLLADGVPFELAVLPTTALRQPPLQALDDTPMPRAASAQLQRLIAEAAQGN